MVSYDINDLLPNYPPSLVIDEFINSSHILQGLDDVKSFAHLILYVSSSEIMFGVKCCTTVRVLGEHMVGIAGLDQGVLYLDTLSRTTHFASLAS